MAIIVGMLGIRKEVLSEVDRRITEKADAQIKAAITPVATELRTIVERLNNGIAERVKEHTAALERQDEKLDRVTAGLAEVKGRLTTYIDLAMGTSRQDGRRSYDP